MMMKNKYLLSLLLLICFNYSEAQTAKDSLLVLLKNHPAQDTLRCHLLSALVEAEEEDAVWIKYNAEIESISKSKLAIPGKLQSVYKKFYAYSIYNQSYYYSIYTKYVEAIVCAKKALAIHRELNNNLAIAADLNIIANNSFKIGKIDESVQYYLQGIELSKQIDDKAGIINLYNNISNVYFSVGDYKKSLEALFEELKVAKQLKSDKDIGDAYASIGGSYGLQGEDENAVIYFNKAIAIQKKLKNNKGIAFSYQNLGKFYSDRNQFKKAIYYFDRALELEKINEIPQTLIFSSDTYFKMKEYDLALKTLFRGLKMTTESNDIENIAVIQFQIGRIYFVKKNFNESQKILEKSLVLSQQIKSLKNVQNCAEILYKIYKIQNKDSQSLKMLELSTQINDSLNREENRNTALKTDFKYQTERKEAEIKELTQQKKIAQLKSDRKSFLIYSIIGGILALSLLFYFMFNRYKTNKQNELLKVELQEAEKTIEAEKKASESELKALKSQMNPHFIFNALNSIQEQFMYGDKRIANEQMGNFTYLTRQILNVSGKKKIPIETEIDILTKYLELEKMRFQNNFEYQIHINENIDEDYLQIPPMIIQPFVENSIKHGLLHKEGEKRLTVHFDLDEKEEFIVCIVEDNGIGRQKSTEIKARNENNHESFSTNSIAQRLQLLDQNLNADDLIVYSDVVDTENKIIGTKVIIKIPIL